ncbi:MULTISPECIES: ABC transporter substrate-binding protein [unclassified Exiguobacterium]|uniref:ABC transporter substrate-binding protein n=1 Tax=unclassified Exiguobacterium TaxID=2644629 RepID=UPI001BEADA25|nr:MULTISPECIES: ABC transporter substrate-binding protein [unclassified Exiguobacterium]MDE0562472.1 ABC transporter substrate-binding protein [Exiguobacterium sp. B2(2022)]
MNKKVSKPLSIVMLSGLVFTAACGGEEEAQVASDPSELEGKEITVGTWKGTDAEVKAFDELLAAFTEETGIKVKKKVYNDYQTQLQTDLVGGTAPDVFYVDAFLAPELSKQGVLEPLDQYIEQAEKDLGDFYEPAINAFKSDDQLFGLPKDYSTLGLYYNKKLIEDAGFTADDIPTEMGQLPEFLGELQEKLPSGVTPAITTSELARHMFVLQSGGTDIVDENGMAVLSQQDQIEALQPLVDAYQDKLVQRPADLGQGWAGDSFGAEKAAIMIEGNWAISHIEQNFPNVEMGTKEVPTIDGNSGSMMFTVSYSLNSDSEEKAAGWEFINYATSKDGMKIWSEGAGVLPSLKSIAEELNLQDDELKAPFVAAGAYATPWQKGDSLSIIAREYNNLLPAALKGDMTLEEAMKKAEETANKDIETQLK